MAERLYGGLEIQEDLARQVRAWRWERIGWAAIVVFVTAALAGLVGPGPLSSTVAPGGSAALEVRYDRFARRLSPTTLEALVAGGARMDGTVRIRLDSNYLASVRLHAVTPTPQSVEPVAGGLAFVFAVAEPSAAFTARFDLEYEAVLAVSGRIGLEGEPPVAFSTFVYP